MNRLSDEVLFDRVAQELADGKVIGWFQGRMEFGPRALGARSILGDARNPKMQSVMNLKIKYRESFRPFAPSVLRERVADYFEMDTDSPYMLLVAPVVEKRRIAPTQGTAGALGYRSFERAEVGHSGSHPRGLFGAHPNRARRDQSPLLQAAQSVRSQDRLRAVGQHFVQRPQRAHRLLS